MPTAAQLAQLLGGDLIGSPPRSLTGVASLDEAGPEQVAVLYAPVPRLARRARDCKAGLLVCGERPEGFGGAILRVTDPGAAFCALLRHFRPEAVPSAGVHPTAWVAPHTRLGAGVAVGPLAVIEAEELGDDCLIGPQVHLGAGVRLGRGCIIGSGARVLVGTLGDGVWVGPGSVLGGRGFGYLPPRDGVRWPIPQVGGLRVGDGAQIGSLCAVDRGTLSDTVIGAHARLDNLVQVGHNASVEAGAVLCGQAGVSGSATIGAGAVLAGQSGVADHRSVGAGAVLLARAAAFRDVPPGQVVGGSPARPRAQWLAERATLSRLNRRAGRGAAPEEPDER